jgi:hypothetical protein
MAYISFLILPYYYSSVNHIIPVANNTVSCANHPVANNNNNCSNHSISNHPVINPSSYHFISNHLSDNHTVLSSNHSLVPLNSSNHSNHSSSSIYSCANTVSLQSSISSYNLSNNHLSS